MDAVATSAIRGDCGPILRGESMVTLEERLHAVSRQIVFCVHPFRSMTVAADFGGDFHWCATFERHDLVLRMTIGAGRRIAMAGGDSFSVHAFCNVLGSPVVTVSACLRQF